MVDIWQSMIIHFKFKERTILCACHNVWNGLTRRPGIFGKREGFIQYTLSVVSKHTLARSGPGQIYIHTEKEVQVRDSLKLTDTNSDTGSGSGSEGLTLMAQRSSEGCHRSAVINSSKSAGSAAGVTVSTGVWARNEHRPGRREKAQRKKPNMLPNRVSRRGTGTMAVPSASN